MNLKDSEKFEIAKKNLRAYKDYMSKEYNESSQKFDSPHSWLFFKTVERQNLIAYIMIIQKKYFCALAELELIKMEKLK